MVLLLMLAMIEPTSLTTNWIPKAGLLGTFVEIVLPEIVPRSADRPTDDRLIPVAARTLTLELFVTENVRRHCRPRKG